MWQATKHSCCSHVLAMIFLRHPWIFCSLCALVIAGFAWLACRGESLATFPQHQPLFSSRGKVQEIPNGSLDKLSSLLHNDALKFVMFYAPWCGQSKKAVPEFRRAANAFHNKVTFIAINCWTGSCRKEYSLDAFPKLFAYHTQYSGLQYPEGYGYHSTHMLRFLRSVVRPFLYPGRTYDLHQLLSTKQEVVLSYFEPYQLDGKGYSVFFAAALSHVPKVSKPVFAVVTNRNTASVVSLNATGEIVFHRAFTSIQAYYPNENTTASNISDWVASNRKQIVTQLTPSSASREELAAQLKRSPALILFLPTRKRTIYTPLLRMFTNAALAYHNCSCTSTPQNETRKEEGNTTDNEQNIQPSSTQSQTEQAHVCRSLVVQRIDNQQHRLRNICDICHQCHLGCSGKLDNVFDVIQSKLVHSNSLAPRSCSSIVSSYYPRSLVTNVCCSTLHDRKINNRYHQYEKKLASLIDSIVDNLLVLKGADSSKSKFEIANLKALLHQNTKQAQKLVNQSDKSDKTVVPSAQLPQASHTPSANKSWSDDVSDGCNRTGHVTQFLGASCHSNMSVNFFYMDSDVYGEIARRLGVRWVASRVALVIADIKNEAQYVLSEDSPLTNETLVNFVMKFMTSRLERRLRSSPPKGVGCPLGHACVVEVTTTDFQDLVIDNNQDVLLVFYTPWCGMCINLTPVLLAVARFFKDVGQLRIARIDGDGNDLPWNLTVSTYPTIILFPAGRKDSSVQFPHSSERTATRLIEFVEEHASQAFRDAFYGASEIHCESDAMRAQLTQLESKLKRMEQEKAFMEKRLEEAMMEKALIMIKNVKLLKGLRETKQMLRDEHSARVTSEQLYQQSEQTRAAAEKELFQSALQNAQLEQELKHRATEVQDKEAMLEKLVTETERVLKEKKELSSLIDEVTRKLSNLRSLTSYFEKREIVLSEKVRRLERISKLFVLRTLDYIGRNSKTNNEIQKLEEEKRQLSRLLREAVATVSGLQASLSSTNQMLEEVTRERNHAVETRNAVKKQLNEMKEKSDER